jgi:hypothetical protein
MKHMNLRVMLLTCLSVTTAALFAGCHKQASSSDLAGTWVPEMKSRKWLKTTNLCEIILETNGTFRATVPDRLMATSDQASGLTVSGHGRWIVNPKEQV